MSWTEVGPLVDIPKKGSRVLVTAEGDVAVFRTSSDQVFALFDQCPHKKGPLSQGLVYDNRVACPLHNWVIDMNSGEATGPDEGCTRTFETKIDNGTVFISL
ncbi:MAG: nitrite reductase small subunit NirD [Pseudomonadota bacterium]|jgi:nitrite reductase (NADH) small subunit|uniref:Ferredoxin subunit of nitrite reductase and ring-hydroxylating dioxygenase n=2 Tax=Methylophaga TaxID=40222 RepID=F5T1Q6_9GAMM|nr:MULTISPECIES: nitrite reductase small subunit NirD [Methylophaga]EGL53049.1 ferredoxin subunit of nitrite reductase and ring-hydroxylating dioxygenase [Methylophaga aminisulfidivorans MP]MEC9413884.1 nitrite reductase small subunit NirD [Pseudomonadota bacterium]GLP99600.1 assimilatory nitrite reductase small subunit [Methylophaga thalassica]